MSEQDPGITGKKLSKSDDDKLEKRNKSYEKVMNLQIDWIRAHQAGSPDADTLRDKWLAKSQWHEKEHGW
jgi:hypothetical protein